MRRVTSVVCWAITGLFSQSHCLLLYLYMWLSAYMYVCVCLFQCTVCLSAVMLILFAVEGFLCVVDWQQMLLQFL